ncbi:hypothetical protein EV356DRAFT_497797 [Viridothelium virens]|uniref:Uncharacterized protein n=1 Tax=Viridothelium virens TaxID=1048519 RepID=A0A6A6HFK1_VIRVR|nr:hypothetical protein EV356DRAFT_497797 [Viridothelium virens]
MTVPLVAALGPPRMLVGSESQYIGIAATDNFLLGTRCEQLVTIRRLLRIVLSILLFLKLWLRIHALLSYFSPSPYHGP